ncbi:MAG: B12-binding domain-containing radical SAM protein [Acidobacteriota bacterium]
MTDVLLGQSYFLRFDPKLWEAMQPYPPLGTLYAAAYLRRCGYEIGLFDAMLAESEQEWATAVDRHRPRYAVLFEDNFNYLSKMCLLRMREAAFTMARMAKERACTVVVCGSDATDHAGAYLGAGADYVIVGEGEVTLGELLDVLSGRRDTPVDNVPGLAFSTASHGKAVAPPAAESPVTVTRPRPVIAELDALPFPAWDLVDVPRYRSVWLGRHGYYSMNMATTRGCPYHCNWCAKPIWGQRYHARSPGNVAEEIAWLKRTYRPDHIAFADDIFGLKPGWVEQFATEVEARDARLPFKSLHRVDLLLREGTIDALARAGAKTVWVGAESGSQKILDAMDKGTKVEQIYRASRRLHDAGVEVCFFLQFGYPGETREDIEKTLQMVRDCRPDDIGMSVSYPLPGTRFFDSVKAELGRQQNWQDSSDLAMLYRGPFTTAFYRQLHTVLHKEFRARRSARQLAAQLRRPGGFRPRHLRQAAAAFFHAATLPVARMCLDRLARRTPEGIGPLPHMAPEAAARPSAQEE